jgi:hypothetical protein
MNASRPRTVAKGRKDRCGEPEPVADCWENIWPYVEAGVRRDHGELVIVPQPPEPDGNRRLVVFRASDQLLIPEVAR